MLISGLALLQFLLGISLFLYVSMNITGMLIKSYSKKPYKVCTLIQLVINIVGYVKYQVKSNQVYLINITCFDKIACNINIKYTFIT